MTDEPAKKRPYKIDPAVAHARAVLGGNARAASQTSEQRSALGRLGAAAREEKRRANGDEPTKRRAATTHDPEMLDYWRGIVKEEQPDREWTSAQELKRAAITRAKQELARMTLDAAKGRGAE